MDENVQLLPGDYTSAHEVDEQTYGRQLMGTATQLLQ